MSKRNKGILLIICSAFCFAVMNMLVRMSGDLPSVQKSFFRNFVAMIFAFILLVRSRTSFRPPKGSVLPLLIRAGSGTLAVLCNYYAVDHLLLADASILNKLSPFFVIIFSYFLLKEKVHPFTACCVAVAFVGSLFVMKPGMNLFGAALPALIGFLGGLCAGVGYTFVRYLGTKNVKGTYIVFFFSTFSCLVTLPFLIFNFHPMTLMQFGFLLLAGVFATGGQFTITIAYTYAPGRDISVYDYSQIIFSTILGFFFLGQIPDGWSFIGYGIIVAASIAVFLFQHRKTPATTD